MDVVSVPGPAFYGPTYGEENVDFSITVQSIFSSNKGDYTIEFLEIYYTLTES